MKTKAEIVANWLPRYTGTPLKDFGRHILLVNFNNYVEMFAKWHKVPIRGADKPMPNATANGIANAAFRVGDAAAIFAGLDFAGADAAVVIDPPRRGCDAPFLEQLIAFGPRTIVYVSCDPATQMRDLATLVPAGYALTAVQPFDLFPQTRHLECVVTLERRTGN